jgi:hypothetical protein
MRAHPDPYVEDGRVRQGHHASPQGRPWGSFVVRHPTSRAELVIIASDGSGWTVEGLPPPVFEHVSVSARDRCPTWEEMCWVKDLFWTADELVIQYHPPREVHINSHSFCLHMWRPVGVEIPLPPPETVA